MQTLYKNRLIYAIPYGTKCLVYAADKKTLIRDKNGYMLEQISTLLPNGNISSIDEGKTLLQGIYNQKERIIYVTDVVLWKDELKIADPAEARLSFASDIINKLLVGPPKLDCNSIQFRLPKIYSCTKETLNEIYYGVPKEMPQEKLTELYAKLIQYIQINDLSTKLNPELSNFPQLFIGFGYDSCGVPYLKDGLGFVEKNASFRFGFSEHCLQWKDRLSSPRFFHFSRSPAIAALYYGRDKKLVTFDGYIVAPIDPAIEKLKPDKIYAFRYQDIVLKDPHIKLIGMEYIKDIKRIVWHHSSQLAYKILAQKNMISYEALLQCVVQQELH